MIDKAALKESVSDTILATPINLFLNFILISLSLWMELNATQMTFFITAVLFVVAIVRKYYVRIYFEKRSS
jgi:O-antigen/teichoic acid export membrane protein